MSDPSYAQIDMDKFIYIGQVNAHNKPHGYGQCKHKDNLTNYIGEFKDGVFEGKGKMFDEEGYLRYEGDFKNDRRQGEGKITY